MTQGKKLLQKLLSGSLNLNLQNVDGFIKPHQIRQGLHLIERYNLIMEDKA
jgi:hypothetical protein